MIGPRDAWRLLHIHRVLVRHGLDEIVLATHLFRPVRLWFHLLPWRWLPRRRPGRGVRIRLALEELGPIFIKFGQLLSTRRDLLPDDIADELARLQDRVPPFPGRQARGLVEQALGEPASVVFERFELEPLASASVAQVHAARLRDGSEVVVKVLRPGIERLIRRDLRLLHTLARLAERYWRGARRLRPRAVVAEYEKVLSDELDLMREAASASQLRRNFEHSGLLYIPEVHWPLTRRGVMVMERVGGVPVSDVRALEAAGTDLRLLAERGVEIFFTQVFRHNFFHADMHPGNIFVDVADPKDPSYLSVDFGIMGSLSPADQRYLAENLLAFFNRDYRRVAEVHLLSEWVPPGTRVDELEAAIRSVCEPIFARPFREISFGHFLVRLFQTARRFGMEVQPQLVLLEKTLLYVEGLGRQLYPELDLWTTAKPFLERWMAEQVGWRGLTRELKAQAPRWGEVLPALPGLVHDVLHKAREGRLAVEWSSPEIQRLREEVRRSSRRSVLASTGGALVVAAAVNLALDGYAPTMLGSLPLATWLLGGLGAIILIGAWPED